MEPKFKAGDRVVHKDGNLGTVVEINPESLFPVKVSFDRGTYGIYNHSGFSWAQNPTDKEVRITRASKLHKALL